MTQVAPHRLTTDLSDLTRELVLEIAAASAAVLEHYIKRAFVRFCEVSQYWHESVDPIYFDPAIETYEISVASGLNVVDVRRVEVGDEKIRKNHKNMGCFPRWDKKRPDSIELFSLDPGVQVDITLSVKPVEIDGVMAVSESILSEYRDDILDGARAGLYRIPQKEWTDLAQFQLCEQRFIEKAMEANRRQANGFLKAPQYTNKPRDFF